MKTAVRISVVLCLSVVPSLWAFDSDGDGLFDNDEMTFWGTSPYMADTDQDGLSDWEEIFVHGTDATSDDTDLDGLTDADEINVYKTNPWRESTDGDRYDDGQEILGTSPYGDGQYGGDMPGYVQSPGDNVFVAAYPVIEIDVDDNIEIIEIVEITFEQGGWNEETVGYSVANTEGSSLSTSQSEAYSQNSWIDVSNAEEDRNQKTSYTEDVSKSEENYTRGFELNNNTVTEIGGELEVSYGILSAGVSARGKVYGSTVNTVETGESGEDYKGHSRQITEGGSELTEKIRKTSNTRGSGNEQSFSTTITRTSYHETTVTNSNAIATGEQWATATTTNPSEAGKLRFVFWLKN